MVDYSAVNHLDRYDAGEMARALTQRVKALRMAEMSRRIESGELALGVMVSVPGAPNGGKVVGYRGLRVIVDHGACVDFSVKSYAFESVRSDF
jgi:hypothetical protein